MWKFCNDDVIFLEKAGRKAPKGQTIGTLKKNLIKFINLKAKGDESIKLTEDRTDDDGFIYDNSFALPSFLEKDYKRICFSDENVLTFEEEKELGFAITPNGLPVYLFEAGGDWEYPLILVAYFDGKTIRGYVPIYGNTVNAMYKTAFGSEGDSEVYFEPYPEVDPCDEDCVKEYAKFLGFKFCIKDEDILNINKDAILRAVDSRITII